MKRSARNDSCCIRQEKESGSIAYLIVRTECFDESNVEALEEENERTEDFGRIDGHVDARMEGDNYHFIYPKGDYEELMAPYVPPEPDGGKETAYIVSVVVSATPDFFDNLPDVCVKQFFLDATDVLVEKYGERRVLSAAVHMDEGTPHLHVNFLPYNEDGSLMDIAAYEEESLMELRQEIYERVGRPWRLQPSQERDDWPLHTREDLDHMTLMYIYSQEELDARDLLQDMRDEARAVEDRMEEMEKRWKELEAEMGRLRQEEAALKQENARLAEEIRKDTDLHAAVDSACAAENKHKGKSKTIRALKARNCILEKQLEASNAENEELSRRLRETEAKLRAAEQSCAQARAFKVTMRRTVTRDNPGTGIGRGKEKESGRRRPYRIPYNGSCKSMCDGQGKIRHRSPRTGPGGAGGAGGAEEKGLG